MLARSIKPVEAQLTRSKTKRGLHCMRYCIAWPTTSARVLDILRISENGSSPGHECRANSLNRFTSSSFKHQHVESPDGGFHFCECLQAKYGRCAYCVIHSDLILIICFRLLLDYLIPRPSFVLTDVSWFSSTDGPPLQLLLNHFVSQFFLWTGK